MWKEAISSETKVSSKRIIMFVMTFLGVVMVLIEAIVYIMAFNKSLNAGNAIQITGVFNDTIWWMVFGLIGGIAGVNGFGKQPSKPNAPENNVPHEE